MRLLRVWNFVYEDNGILVGVVCNGVCYPLHDFTYFQINLN